MPKYGAIRQLLESSEQDLLSVTRPGKKDVQAGFIGLKCDKLLFISKKKKTFSQLNCKNDFILLPFSKIEINSCHMATQIYKDKGKTLLF